MPLSFNEPHITDQLSQAIRKMGDFLLKNPTGEEYYKKLSAEIITLTIKAHREGYYNYKHCNPYQTLSDFLNQNNTAKLVEEYYSIPVWSKKLIELLKTEKVVRSGKKFTEWIIDQIAKFIPFKSS